MPRPRPETLAAAVLAGDRRAAARALTAVENGLDGAADLVDQLYPRTGGAWRIGITGPPGAGKSTLTDRLVAAFRAQNKTVAVVAVDPSSPFTGGALLGDRVRMTSGIGDDGVFVRSLAARGALGGLSLTTEAACDVLDAAGFDVLLVETVGVGQGEIDVAQAADTVLVVLVPASGDAVQAMKAGLMEVADLFAVNKADQPEASLLVRALGSMLRLRTRSHRSPQGQGRLPSPDEHHPDIPVIVKTSATKNEGIDRLVEALAEHRAALESAGVWDERRDERLKRRVRELVEVELERRFWTSERRSALAEAVATLDGADRSPHRLAGAVLESASGRSEGGS